MRKLQFIVLLVVYLTLFFALQRGNTAIHESVHQKINAIYGIESEIKVNNVFKSVYTGISGVTIPLNDTEYSLYCKEKCKELHTLNEIENYNNQYIFYAIFTAVGFMIITFIINITERRSN